MSLYLLALCAETYSFAHIQEDSYLYANIENSFTYKLAKLEDNECIYADVEPDLQHIYGTENPCENPLLKLNMEELRYLTDREFEKYKIVNEKCENYKIALSEYQNTIIDAHIASRNDSLLSWIVLIGGVWVVWLLIKPDEQDCHDCTNVDLGLGNCC